MTAPIFPTSSNETFEALRHLMQKFFAAMGYTPLRVDPSNKEIEASLLKSMKAHNFHCKQLEKTLQLVINFSTLCYPQTSIEEKAIASLYTWIVVYVDDLGFNDPTTAARFEQRFVLGLPQPHPILDVLADLLRDVFNKWDDLGANHIMHATMAFMSCTCVEESLENGLALVPNNSRFAWFLREGNGLARAYISFNFPKSMGVTAVEYIQAVPDMEYWINVGNDLFSFYKEELEGETNTFVHIRAKHENKTPLQVLSDIVDELIASRDIIHSVLAGNPQALHIWKVMEQGYIEWHVTQTRYRLYELQVCS